MHTTFGSRSAVAIAIGMLLVGSVATPVAADAGSVTRWVDDDGFAGPTGCGGSNAATSTIQAAVDASDTNDVVIVCPGTYQESVTIAGARNGLTVRGFSKWTAVVRAPGDAGEALILVDGPNRVTIQHLKLVFPTAGCEDSLLEVTGILAEDADRLTVRGNQVRASGADTTGDCGYDDGIVVLGSRHAFVHSNLIQDYKSDGISLGDESSGTIKGNSVRFFHAAETSGEGDSAIKAYDSSPVTIAANVIRSLSSAGETTPIAELGIGLIDADGAVVRDNVVSYHYVGIYSYHSASALLRDNRLTGAGQDIGFGIYTYGAGGSSVRENRIRRYDLGIIVQDGGNTFRDNDSANNGTLDCRDDTSGSGTGGTDNTWVDNFGDPADPDDICDAP